MVFIQRDEVLQFWVFTNYWVSEAILNETVLSTM